jgi:Protein of unknown function (DUF2815)
MSIITPDATISYPHLFTPTLPPNPRPGQKARYQCVLLFPRIMSEVDIAKLRSMKHEALKALQEKWGNKVEEMLQGGRLRWPFRKDWINAKGAVRYDEKLWQCFISPWSEQAPGIVSRFAGPDGKPTKLTDASLLYPGAVVRVSVNTFVYEQSGNLGVNFGLQNVQLRDSTTPRLDNRRNAEDEFEGEPRPEADLGDVGTGPGGATANPATTVGAVPGAEGQMQRGSTLTDLFT